MLISRGHSFEAIKMYTIDQIVLFYQYAVGARIDYMNDVRTAVWADKDELNQHINAIRG